MDLRQFQRRLARRVRGLRHQRNLRQEDLDAWDLAWKTIQKLEYGLSDPKISTLLKLCRAFDIGLIELLAPIVTNDATLEHSDRERVRPRFARRR